MARKMKEKKEEKNKEKNEIKKKNTLIKEGNKYSIGICNNCCNCNSFNFYCLHGGRLQVLYNIGL